MSSKMFADTTQKAPVNDPLSNPPPSAPPVKMSMFDVMGAPKQQNPPQKVSMFGGTVTKPPAKTEPPINAELILIMGDVHIPSRIDEIPKEIKEILDSNKGKFSRILCTGDFGTLETYEYFKSLLPKSKEWNFNAVKNDFQETNLSFPDSLVVKSNDYRIGIINGYQIVPWGDLTVLSALSKQMECDILVSGFTHLRGVFHFEGKWFINPGTITGAFSPLTNNPQPSFMVLFTLPDNATLYLYEFNQGSKQFDVSKIDLTK
jgi:vacuolar protein sorting-associated protein 29